MTARPHDRRITVLLADDQALMRSGFTMILSTEPDIDVVGTASNGVEAIEAVQAFRPDVVLMDVQMPVLDGIEATRQLISQPRPHGEAPPKIVIVTTFDRDDYLFDALDAGASGFLLKNAEAEDLVEAVRTVFDGHALLAPEVTRRVIAAAHRDQAQQPQTHMSPAARTAQPMPTPAASTPAPAGLIDELTAREKEVLITMATGLSNAEIAATLFLSEATVKTHVSRILAKLSVRDRVQAVIAAFGAGLVPPPS